MKLFFILINLVVLSLLNYMGLSGQNYKDIIIDSDFSLPEAIKGISIPDSIKSNLILLYVEYYSFDNNLHRGQLVINKKIKKDIEEIFLLIKENKFPVAKVVPVVKYNWSDDSSMIDNNTSCFNYRKVEGSNKYSNHAFGLAVDINPLQNPMIKNKKIYPPNAKYDIKAKGTLSKNSFLVKEFIKRGWSWGGNWKTLKDYQHFEKIF